MKRVVWLLAVLPCFAHCQPKPLPDPVQKVECLDLLQMQKESKETIATNIGKWGLVIPLIEAHWKKVDELIKTDALHTGADFYVASLEAGDVMNFLEHQELAHELAITSLLLDEPNAPALVARSWDRLITATGRLPRLGTTFSYDFEKKTPIPAPLDPDAISSIAQVLLNPEEAKKTANSATDSKELADIRAADQKEREGDMSKPMSDEESMAWSKRDRDRQARVLEILKAGGAKNAKDYEAAALVLQHSSKFEGYELAHELCLASLALGSKEAAWLVSRTYDRMLLAAGYRQRYGTNSNMRGLMPYSEGINDRMRRLASVKPLAEQIKNGEEWRKKVLESTKG
ncbi:MAG: hypothetical protein QOJ65_2476 [Fimbriimonadaceae bacterium]|jgi:hypothetical protein|nr:hypothetical protein [Fimbriimonadaceae bacterium]